MCLWKTASTRHHRIYRQTYILIKVAGVSVCGIYVIYVGIWIVVAIGYCYGLPNYYYLYLLLTQTHRHTQTNSFRHMCDESMYVLYLGTRNYQSKFPIPNCTMI